MFYFQQIILYYLLMKNQLSWLNVSVVAEALVQQAVAFWLDSNSSNSSSEKLKGILNEWSWLMNNSKSVKVYKVALIFCAKVIYTWWNIFIDQLQILCKLFCDLAFIKISLNRRTKGNKFLFPLPMTHNHILWVEKKFEVCEVLLMVFHSYFSPAKIKKK